MILAYSSIGLVISRSAVYGRFNPGGSSHAALASVSRASLAACLRWTGE
jgi:hypothetical protein